MVHSRSLLAVYFICSTVHGSVSRPHSGPGELGFGEWGWILFLTNFPVDSYSLWSLENTHKPIRKWGAWTIYGKEYSFCSQINPDVSPSPIAVWFFAHPLTSWAHICQWVYDVLCWELSRASHEKGVCTCLLHTRWPMSTHGLKFSTFQSCFLLK